MSKCHICGTEQKVIGDMSIKLISKDYKNEADNKVVTSLLYNIDLMTCIQGKSICTKCMDIYHKIYALESGISFSSGGTQYYADGRNLI